MLSDDDKKKLNEIFFPYATEKENEFLYKKIKLAYYTNSETAINIIKNGELWLKNTSVMNDYGEILQGGKYIDNILSNSTGNQLKSILCECTQNNSYQEWDNLINYFIKHEFVQWLYKTYIICFTEHLPEDNNIGRLSMWRAYGGGNGVAFVFNSLESLKSKLSDDLGIALTPVAYLTNDSLIEEFEKLIKSIKNNKKFLIKIDPIIVQQYVLSVLRYAIVAIKHYGFNEEKEWRFFSNSDYLINISRNRGPNIETIRGIVQPVFKIKWRVDNQKINFLSNVLERIIIAPTQYDNIKFTQYNVFANLLHSSLGIPTAQAQSMVINSNIPYRNI